MHVFHEEVLMACGRRVCLRYCPKHKHLLFPRAHQVYRCHALERKAARYVNYTVNQQGLLWAVWSHRFKHRDLGQMDFPSGEICVLWAVRISTLCQTNMKPDRGPSQSVSSFRCGMLIIRSSGVFVIRGRVYTT